MDLAQSSTAAHMAPDWETRARLPGLAVTRAKVEFKPRSGRMIPRQLGPRTRTLYERAISSILRSMAAPMWPIPRSRRK